MPAWPSWRSRDESAGAAVVPTLDGLEASTKRATDLTLQIISYAAGDDTPAH